MPRIRKTSGGKEETLLSRARELRRDPSVLLPELAPGCPEAPFERIRTELDNVKESADDPEALKRLMVRGEDLARAYAALLYFAEERPEAVMAVARYPTGEIPYLPLGSASPEGHIAVQYYNDPKRLLIGYLQMARPRLLGPGGFHFYAMQRRVICTGREATPPAEFLSATISRLPYRLAPGGSTEEGDLRVCVHLQRGEKAPYLEVHWEAARASFRVCRRCVRGDAHMLSSLLESMAVPDPGGVFALSLAYPLEHKHGGECPVRAIPSMGSSEERTYRKGRLSDADLLAGYLKQAEESILSYRGAAFVAAGRCYGGDAPAFIAGLSPTPAEKVALESVVPALNSPILVPDATAGKALEFLWKEHAEELIEAMGVGGEEAERLVAEFRNSPGRVSELLERLFRKGREMEVLATLPDYADMVPEATFCVDASRVFRTHGASTLEQRLITTLPEGGKVRSLAWAFLLTFGSAAERHKWRFTEKEQEFGAALQPAAKRLLEASPADYHDAMAALLSAAGVTSWGRKVTG